MIGISFGLYMSYSHVFHLATVHVLFNLFGWLSLALIGMFYHFYPGLAGTNLARWHFWLHNIGLPVMIAGIAMGILESSEINFSMATAGGSVAVIGIFCFGCNVLINLGD